MADDDVLRQQAFLKPALILALIVHAVLGLTFALHSWPRGDFDRFWEISTAAGRPYVDFPVERAPGEVAGLKVVATLAGSRPFFRQGLLLVNLAADTAIVIALLWGWGMPAAVYFLVAVLPILDVLDTRIDLWSMAAATIAVAAWRRDRREIAAACLVLGGAFKLWPLPFALLLAVPGRTRFSARPLLLFVGLAVGLGSLWLVWTGWTGVYQVLTFRGARGWQIETVVGNLVHLFTTVPARFESGSWRIGTVNGPVSVFMFTAAAPVAAWSVWRGGRTGRLGAGWLAAVSALLLCSALFSLQFMGWLVPGGAIAWAENDRRQGTIAALAVLLTGIFWRFYSSIIDGHTAALLVLTVRNGVVVWLAASAARVLVQAPDRARARMSPGAE